MAETSTTWQLDGLQLTDHVIEVPWDHDDPTAGSLEVFARVVEASDGGDRPFLLFLQGGPGQESPRPTGTPAQPGWLDRALRDYRVVLLDQRGTGRSTPYGPPGPDAEADARYLTRFRADAIVRDAELLREHLGARRWSLLGQSFGGFCVLRYLSSAAESVAEAFVTGGLPPVGVSPDDVYRATFARTRVLEDRFHAQFPGDRDRLAAALAACDAGAVRLPAGAPVSPRLLQTIGNQLGMTGGAAAIHYLLERDPASPAFAADLAGLLPFGGRNPLYAVVHESCYADGHATRWAAQRVQPSSGEPRFTAEHVFDWHLDEQPELVPYAPVARILADHTWPRLYDESALAGVDVPGAAAVYTDDPFVDRDLSLATADLVPGMTAWETDRYLHNGLRVDGEAVLGRLIEMVRG